MAAVIVGIHGLANKPAKQVLAGWWDRSIREGLAVTCKKPKPDYQFEMVYWADLLYANTLHRKKGFDFDPLYNKEPYRKARKNALVEHDDGWVDEARRIFNAGAGKVFDLIDKHFGADALSKVVIDKVLRDLSFYYDDKRKIVNRNGQMWLARRVLMDELKNSLLGIQRDGRELILIAHSMGSIIAYDVLREIGRKDPKFKIDRFVTIGSPLGLPTVKLNVYEANKRRAKTDHVRTPSVVRKTWINFADRHDPVCFDNHLSDDYGANKHKVKVVDDIILNDYVGQGGRRNAHKSYGYLRTPEMSNFLNQFV